MGWLARRHRAPVVHAPVERTVYVPANRRYVDHHLESYGKLFSPHLGEEVELQVAEAHGWTAVRLPEAVHPWQLHHLARWMADCPGQRRGEVLAVSGAAPHHPGYRLVVDPEIDDALCGWDDEGEGWTVLVPTNDVHRGDPPPVTRQLTVPEGFVTWQAWPTVFEDPGRSMNPLNSSTRGSRRDLDRAAAVL